MSKTGRAAVGHPVDVATGTLFNYYQDFSLRGKIALSFVRYYSTALIGNGSGPLGIGFRHNYQHELRQSLEGFVYVDPDGNEQTLADDGSFDATGRLVFPPLTLELRGTRDRIELEQYGSPGNGVLVFARRPGSKLYDLVSVEAHANNRLDLVHDESTHQLRTITQTRTGHVMTLRYDQYGRIAEVTCVAGVQMQVAAFTYDQLGDLVTVSDPEGVAAHYQYDQHRMTSEAIRGRSVHEFRFDSRGRCIQASGPNDYEARRLRFDDAAKVTVVTDSKGVDTTYQYNDAGQIVALTDGLGHVSQIGYDEQGRVVSQTNASGMMIQRRYDAHGHLAGVDYPDKTSYELTWSDRHNILTAQGPAKLVWKYEYDSDGQLVSTENPERAVHQYAFDQYGQVTSVTTPLGARYHYHYDPRGYFVAFTSAQGATTQYQLDQRGNRLAEISATGATARFAYDHFDRLVEAVDYYNRSWRFAYDSQGRIWREYSPNGEYIEYDYNTCGLPIAVRRPDGTAFRFDWDTEPGRVLAIHDAKGNSLRYAYDALGSPVERQSWDGTVTRFERDPMKRLSASTGPDGVRQEFSYDDFGLMIERRSGDVADTFEYDINGFLVAARSPGHDVLWERDLYGRATAEVQDGHRIEYTYNAGGRRTKLKDALGETVDYEYNLASQLTRIGFGGQQIKFDYNELGQELTRFYSGGGRFDRKYGANGRLEQEWFTPPPVPGALASGTPGRDPLALRRDYGYHPQTDHLELIRDSLRGATELTHDSLGQLRAAVRYWGFAEYFDFDAAGNRTVTARVSSSAPPPPSQVFAPGLGANSLNVQVLAAGGAQIETRALGPGNRTLVLNRPTETIQYEFDASGFLQRKTVSVFGQATQVWRFTWSPSGQLSELAQPDGQVWKYEYDALGRRLKKSGPAGATTFVWEGRRLLHVLQDGQSPITLVNDPVAFEALMRKRGEDVHFVLPDHMGATSELVAPNGVLSWWRLQDSWGKPAAGGEGEPGFMGQWLDAESGLYYNDYRYYDPELGRYISPDPIGIVGGLNEYGYVACPFEGVDPHGLANALGGGPFDYPGQTDSKTGAADPRNGPRQVSSRSSGTNPPEGPYGTRTVPAPGTKPGKPDSGGKCLAVVTGPPIGGEKGQGKTTHAFVSGQGREPHTAPHATNPDFHVGNGQMGNYTHAEIQALHFLGTAPPGDYTLRIDRPLCPKCDTSVPEMLERLPKGVNVTVESWDSKKGKYVTFPPQAEGGC